MFNHPDNFDPAAAEPPTLRDDPSLLDDHADDPDIIMQAIIDMHRECSVAKQHKMAMKHLGALGMLPLVAPFNASIALTTDPEASYLATASDWSQWARAPKSGSTPIPIQKAMGPVSYVWDIRNTVKTGPPQTPLGFLDPPEVHRMALTEYPAPLDRCMRKIIKFTGSTKSGSKLKDEDADRVNMLPQQWNNRVYDQTREIRGRDIDPDEKIGLIVRACAALVLGHEGDTPTRTSRSHISPEAMAFEQATVEWILHQVLTNESVVPDDLRPFTSGEKMIPDGIHLKWTVSTASKFYGAIRRDTLPKTWSPFTYAASLR